MRILSFLIVAVAIGATTGCLPAAGLAANSADERNGNCLAMCVHSRKYELQLAGRPVDAGSMN